MIRLEIGLEIRHIGVMSLCVTEDLPLLLLHHIAVLQEIPFVSRRAARMPAAQNVDHLLCSSLLLLYGILAAGIIEK